MGNYKGRAHYSQDVRAAAMTELLLGQRTIATIAAETGISERTLTKWKAQAQAAEMPETAPVRAKKAVLELLEEGIQAYGAQMLSREKIEETSGYYAAVTLKILNEQRQLMTGGPTQRIDLATFLSSVHNPPAERIDEPVYAEERALAP